MPRQPRQDARAGGRRASRARAPSPAKAAKRPPARGRRTEPKTPPRAGGRSGAEALVAQLELCGIDTVFGIPGVHNLAIFDALRRSGIRTVLVRHEQTAVYAADGYARATGRLAVALTTTGPGAANTAGAMGEARAARSPVLHLSTQIESRLLEGRSGRFSLHESPHQRALMDAVSIWSATVARAEAIPSMVSRATGEAFRGRRGPVFLDVPHDLLSESVSWKPQPPIVAPAYGPDAGAVARAVDALRAATRPLIWVGGGAVSSGAGDLVGKIAEILDAPIVTTFAGKGIVPPDHPLLVGLPPHQPEVTKLIAASDAVLIVGSDLDAMNTQGWRLPLPRPRIAINTIGEDGRRNYACDVVMECDARVGLEMVLAGLDVRTRPTAARRVAAARTRVDAAVARTAESAAPVAFVRSVERVAGDAFVVADMAIPGYWLGAYYRAPTPRSFAYPLGWGTLGYALPAAIGAAASGRRALAVAGDAGALFAIGELATASQEALPLTLLVVDDGGYGMLRYDERARYRSEFASDLTSPDFVALARSFGVPARRCEEEGLEKALRWALGRDGPALVLVRARWAPPITTSPRWPLKGKPEARP